MVSDNVLLQPKNVTGSVGNIMDQKPKINSDTILALPQVRGLLLAQVIRPEPHTVKDVQDKFYDGHFWSPKWTRRPTGLP